MISALLAAVAVPVLPARADTQTQLDSFATNIETAFQNRCVGYGYAIYENGVFVRGGGGGDRYKSDHPLTAKPFDENTQKDCHSMSKTITAAAMIRALQLRGLGLDAKIYDYCPKKFQQNIPNNSFKWITFEQLLAHRTGFADSAKTWNELLDELKDGFDYPTDTASNYCNWNYGMCRLLIPYVLYPNSMRNIEGKVSQKKLAAACADIYIKFTRDWILEPADVFTSRTRPPQNPQAHNFAYLYEWLDPSREGIMPDRRLDIGSGGWAMSAREFGRFLAALFDGELLDSTVKVGDTSVDTLDYMKQKTLGMWPVTGSAGERYYNHRGANNWPDQKVGGKSVWMHYPSSNMIAVVLINSRNNATTAGGVQRQILLQEAYDEAFTSPRPSGFAYPVDMFCGRNTDGWILGRGVRDDGKLGARNFDVHGETGWALTRFFETPQQTFMLRYKRDNGGGFGSLMIQEVRPDGTFADVTYSGDTWSMNWTQMEVFHKNNGADTFLACYRRTDGKFRIYRIEADGEPVGPALTDTVIPDNFVIMEVVNLDGEDHLFLHNSANGFTQVLALKNDGSSGGVVYQKNWSAGYPSFNFFTTGTSHTYILRYNPIGGHANILRFNSTVAGLDQTTVILDQDWDENWVIMRFFRTEAGTFNFRYDPFGGRIRIQQVGEDGSFGDVVVSDNEWLRPRPADPPFQAGTTGWDSIEFYVARDIVNQPIPPRIGIHPPLTTPGEDEDFAFSLPAPSNPRPPVLEPAVVNTTSRAGDLFFSWNGRADEMYFIERSRDMRTWEPIDLLPGEGTGLNWSLLLEGIDLESEPQGFFRVRTIEGAPE